MASIPPQQKGNVGSTPPPLKLAVSEKQVSDIEFRKNIETAFHDFLQHTAITEPHPLVVNLAAQSGIPSVFFDKVNKECPITAPRADFIEKLDAAINDAAIKYVHKPGEDQSIPTLLGMYRTMLAATMKEVQTEA